MPYLPALDGIRALAVLAVVLYHAGALWLPAGFLGVDVFFVVSGFLITALLVAERERAGGVELLAFWLRRARRLLPALALLLAVTTIYAVIALGDQLLTHLREVLAATVYITNWDLILRDISYFEMFDRPSQLRHLWSLAVEEQFYLLWPIVFAVGARFLSRRALTAFVLLLAAASLGWMAHLYQPGDEPSRVYFGSDPRAFTILLGVALGLVWRPWRWSWPEDRRSLARLLDLVGLAGLAVVAAIMLSAHWWEAWLYPWGLLSASLGSAAIIAAVAARRSALGRALALPPLRWLGLRSYGVYLWHWPVLLALQWEYELSGWALLAAGAALSAALAEASYRWLETPVRRGEFWQRWRRRPPTLPRRAWSAAALAALAAAVLGLVLINPDNSSAFPQPESTTPAVVSRPTEPVAEQRSPEPSASALPAASPSPPQVDITEPRLRARAATTPRASRREPVATAEPPARTAAPSASDPQPDPQPDPLLANSPAPREPATFAYRVRLGDAPRSLARTFNTTVERLVELNGEQILQVIHTDDLLMLPCPDDQPCALIEIATRGSGCLSWRSRLGEDQACGWRRALVGLPASFGVESGPLDTPTIWEWRGERLTGSSWELTEADAASGFEVLVVRFGAAPLAIGDSVMRDATAALSENGVDVDAVGARTARDSMAALAQHLAASPRDVVVFQAVGYGFVNTADFERLLNAARGVDHLIVLTRQFPPRDPWIWLEREGNKMLRREAPKHDHVTLIDWNQVTDGREDELTSDGTHLTPKGLALYLQLILNAINTGPPAP